MLSLHDSLERLHGTTTQAAPSGAYPEPGQASVKLTFSDGTHLRMDYWRLIKDGRQRISSFDHEQKYGLPAPLDAIQEITEQLNGRDVVEAKLDQQTGDLIFEFAGSLKLQILNLTGYEVWEIHFPDGTGEYSPHAI